ncbi:hypothetical protein BO86DRAFT_407275 [Aspergillus japonicus CBS 114.51]|uniref:Uncharacterized protein n=2 Tax=Aspergillus TaxID=5052 RepID=A0A2V5H0V9_ASPV1|nr:hypothetical protein BO86DRAFT_407275 [Aspergillus japonicus CBS 114.51]PYI17488.1 hypothetical protein BO99DRAFT_388773 [Aspergillus violaceofuscus CBS 115571]RAH85481.1 hypothetical protein BO86DRAFT_407275 [Aspergillus japonicus CBS 114.51]
MSTPSTPGAKPEKTMSSRLLTMKFMQRAAAEKSTPQSSGETSTTPISKRQRLSTGSVQSPSTPQSDMDAVAAALAAEEEKRKEALARQAAESGDTEWVLDYGFDAPAPRPFVVADSSLDADDDEMVYGGRQAYGNYKRKKKSAQAGGDEDESDEDDDSEADPNDMDAMIKKAKKKAQKKEKNKPQPVKLSALTSISGGRHGGGGGGDKKQKKRKHK